MGETLRTVGFEEQLLPMLISAAGVETKKRKRRRRAVVGGLMAVAVIVASMLIGVAAGRGQTISVDGMQALRDPQAVERALAAEGIDATILVVPLPAGSDDYWNGRWYSLYFDRASEISQAEFDHLLFQVGEGNGTEEITLPDGSTTGAAQVKVLELPKDLPGHITLLVGRTVSPGDATVFPYDQLNALSPIGSLYCLGLNPDDPVAVGDALAARGYSIKWTLESGNQGSAVNAPPSGTVVTWAWITGPHTADVRLAPSGAFAKTYQRAEGTFQPSQTPPWQPACP